MMPWKRALLEADYRAEHEYMNDAEDMQGWSDMGQLAGTDWKSSEEARGRPRQVQASPACAGLEIGAFLYDRHPFYLCI